MLRPGSSTWPKAIAFESPSHPWMNAHVYVGESGRPRVSDLAGRFEFLAVEVDPVVLRLWHSELGAAEVIFQLPLRPEGKKIRVSDWL